MVNITEAQVPAPDDCVIEVMPNTGHPVTHWLVVGPFQDIGPETDRNGVPDWMFDDGKEALAYARETAESWPFPVRVVTYPPDPIG
jgi:hypothetical protein